MNIYITPANEERLRGITAKGYTMSGLVNELLAGYFKKPEIKIEARDLPREPSEQGKPKTGLESLPKNKIEAPEGNGEFAGPLFRNQKRGKI